MKTAKIAHNKHSEPKQKLQLINTKKPKDTELTADELYCCLCATD